MTANPPGAAPPPELHGIHEIPVPFGDVPADAVLNPTIGRNLLAAGTAATLYDRFGPPFHAALRDACRAGLLRPGRLHPWPTGAPAPKWIVSLGLTSVTAGSRLDHALDAAFARLRRWLRHGDATSIVIHARGFEITCRDAGLAWAAVDPVLRRHCHDLPLPILVSTHGLNPFG